MQCAFVTPRGTAFLRRGCSDQCGSLSKGPSVSELEPPAAYVTTTTAAAEQTLSVLLWIIVDHAYIIQKHYGGFQGGLTEHFKESHTC